jgi:hypothetical protein
METTAPGTLSARAYKLRAALIVGLTLIVTGVMLFAVAPFAQPNEYHNFADNRSLLHVPNALNVLSNIPFVLVGSCGLYFMARPLAQRHLEPGGRSSYTVFFALIALTGVGSAYYHAEPNNDRLLWDRLPLAMAFMAIFAVMISERINQYAGRMLFWPFVIVGAWSVFYWHQTEMNGAGDLRVYLLVQFFPLLAIPLMLFLFPARYTLTGDLFAALGCYVIAKLLELADGLVYAQGGLVSGHTLKHLVAAITPLFILHMLLYRRPIEQAIVASGPTDLGRLS